MTITTHRHGAATVIRMANGQVNALSVGNGHVSALADAIGAALDDSESSGIILVGEGRMFCGGADIADFRDDPSLVDVVRRMFLIIEQADKPVVAALHGMALGGGLELALACHYRIAAPNTKLGLPEVSLGILPGAGGTQRLPRLVGAGEALGMMTSGRPVAAEKALTMGLIDAIDTAPLEAAIARVEQGSVPLRKTGEIPAPSDISGAVEKARAALQPNALSAAPARIVDCVAALSDDLEAGLSVEADAFAVLLASASSKALRHAFTGERLVSHVPGISADARPRAIENAGVVGGGLMGTGIAIALLSANISVTLIELEAPALERAGATIRKTIQREVDKGRLPQAEADARLAALTLATDLGALGKVELVIEAVFEDMAVKENLLRALDDIVLPDCIVASNTSTLDIDAMASHLRDPSRFLGLHFFSPANVMPLLEIVRGASTAPELLATAMGLAKRLRKVGVVSGVCDGFIGNRIFEAYLRQAWFLLEEGALPQDIDAALERWGMAMGPCRTMDMVGQDIGWAIRKRRAATMPDQSPSVVIDRVCELGRFGLKTGSGIYAYPDGRTAQPDAEIEDLITAWSAEKGIERRVITDEEIVDRCLLALVNEGAQVVGEGIAYRPVDVDTVFLNGYGFARERGGPMFQADLMGLHDVLRRMKSFAGARNGWAWTPAPLIEKLAGEGRGFSDLNH